MADIVAAASVLSAALVPIVGAALWWKLGRLEGRMNGTAKEWTEAKEQWRKLKATCPLCPKE